MFWPLLLLLDIPWGPHEVKSNFNESKWIYNYSNAAIVPFQQEVNPTKFNRQTSRSACMALEAVEKDMVRPEKLWLQYLHLYVYLLEPISGVILISENSMEGKAQPCFPAVLSQMKWKTNCICFYLFIYFNFRSGGLMRYDLVLRGWWWLSYEFA